MYDTIEKGQSRSGSRCDLQGCRFCALVREDKGVRSQVGLDQTWLGLYTAVVMAVEAGKSSASLGNSTYPGGHLSSNHFF